MNNYRYEKKAQKSSKIKQISKINEAKKEINLKMIKMTKC